MDSIAGWLASISWPLISRALVALGIGTVTYTGVNTAVTGAFDSAKVLFSGMTAEVLQLLAKAGMFEAMSIMSGGVISGLAFLVLNKFALRAAGV